MVVPLNIVPTAELAGTSTCKSVAAGAVPVSLYQARPKCDPAWLSTYVAVKPHSGENALGVMCASLCQSMVSPRWENSV